VISVYYDPMISKLVSYGSTREIAIAKMKRALQQYKIIGIKTNINFLLRLLQCDEFINGNYNTQFIEKTYLKRSNDGSTPADETIAALSLAGILYRENKKPKVKLNSNSNNHHTKSNWVAKRAENYR